MPKPQRDPARFGSLGERQWDVGKGFGNAAPTGATQVNTGPWEDDGFDVAEESMEVVDFWAAPFPPEPPALHEVPTLAAGPQQKRREAAAFSGSDGSWSTEGDPRSLKRMRGSSFAALKESVDSSAPASHTPSASSASTDPLDNFFNSRPQLQQPSHAQEPAEGPAHSPARRQLRPPPPPTRPPSRLLSPARPVVQPPLQSREQLEDGKGSGKRRLRPKGKPSNEQAMLGAVKIDETIHLSEGSSALARPPSGKGSKKSGLVVRPPAPPVSQVRKGGQASAADAEALAKCVRISVAPIEWNHLEVEKLCNMFGQVDSVMPASPYGYEVIFKQPQEAESAVLGISGLEVECEAGPIVLECELLPAEGVPPRDMASMAQGAEAKSWRAASCVNAQVFGDIAGKGHPILVYVDELQLLDTLPDARDHEVFLRNLPIHDYTTSELYTWLQAFGDVEDLFFRRDHAGLIGSGYIRYRMHDEAADLVQTLLSNSEHSGSSRPGVMQASWSLSERMLQESSKGLRTDLCRVLARSLERLQESKCSALALVGDGMKSSRLHFAAWLQERSEEVLSSLHGLLAELLAEGLSQEPQDEEVRGGELVAEVPQAAVPVDDRHAKVEPLNGQSPSQLLKRAQEEEQQDEDHNPDDFLRRCIFLQGFPPNWMRRDVLRLFEKYGGATALRFVEDPIGRAAQVELQSAERMATAVEGLNNKQVRVKASNEWFVLQCEMIGEENVCTSYTVFIDELPMPCKPEVPPGANDREVFFQGLPASVTSEDQLVQWLSGFGMIEDALILKDRNTDHSKGKAYVRFQTPSSAGACIKMHSSGSVAAQWSESERALQRTLSVYRADLQDAFAERGGRILPAVLQQAKVSKLSMHTQVQHAAPTAARRIHFVAECSFDQFEGVRVVLSNVLASFHARVGARLQTWMLPKVEQRF